MIVATESFAGLAREEAEAQGLAGARIAVVPHPMGGTRRSVLESRGDAVVDQILSLLTAGRPVSRTASAGNFRTK